MQVHHAQYTHPWKISRLFRHFGERIPFSKRILNKYVIVV